MRPYRPGPCRVGAAALMLVVASFLMFAALVVAMSGAVSTAGVIAVLAAVLIALTLRLLHAGVRISHQGLRRVGLLYTSTLPWDRIARVRTSQQPVRWLGLPRTVQGQAVLVTRADGQVLPPLMTDHNADFIGRTEAFDRAADAVEEWATVRARG